MTYDVAQYVRACLTCRRAKSHREGKQGLLHPLPIPDRYWSSISMDYITHLPLCTDNGRTYENILVIVDQLSKKKKFILVVDLRVDTLVQAFVEYVWREEGYPQHIVSDRGPQFTSHFWTRLCQRLGTRPKLSTAYHPETDGQTENANAFLKQYLRAYVNYEQDNWALLLPMAEFKANSAINASTGISAFVATKGYEPRSGIELAKALDAQLTAPARRDQLNADKFAERLDKLREFLRQQITWAQAKQAEYANNHRLPALEFKSLDYKNRGPFLVTRVIDNMAYEVALPAGMRAHNVFHPWLLHRVSEQPLPGQVQDEEGHFELADPDIDNDTNYSVEAVLDSRINKQLRDPALNKKGLLQYQEPYMNLVDSADLVTEFYHRRPTKPGPHRDFGTLVGRQDLMIMAVRLVV
ncbi:rve domain containing protein [Pyrenophora tritici-repentis]|nr:rve domain containing protein [Pyrenophora tritici-repentis]